MLPVDFFSIVDTKKRKKNSECFLFLPQMENPEMMTLYL